MLSIWFIAMCGDPRDYCLLLYFSTISFSSMIKLMFYGFIFSNSTSKFLFVFDSSYKTLVHNILSHLRSFRLIILSSLYTHNFKTIS